MSKAFRTFAITWAILLALFCVICFVSPNTLGNYYKIDAAFWVGFAFICTAFIGEIVVFFLAFRKNNLQKLFYNIPVVRIGYVGLVFICMIGAVTMIVPGFPYWLGIILCFAVVAFTAVSMLKAAAAAVIVADIDKRVKAKTLFIKSLTADAETLLARATTPEAKEACNKVYEAIRYSDPMSDDALAGVESQITLKFNELSDAVTGDAENIEKLANELVVLVGDRNKKCKLLK